MVRMHNPIESFEAMGWWEAGENVCHERMTHLKAHTMMRIILSRWLTGDNLICLRGEAFYHGGNLPLCVRRRLTA